MSDRVRKGIRFSAEDDAWLAENAEDEGVEPATLVRMIINRLRRGRPPLMSMIVAPATVAPSNAYDWPGRGQMTQPPEGADAEDVLAARLNELDGADVVQLHGQPEEEVAAIPLLRMPRQQYNPGRN